MRILSIDCRIERRIRIRALLDLTGNSYELREVCSVGELEPGHDCSGYRLAFIGGEDMPETLHSVAWLRDAMPDGHIVALCHVSAFDEVSPRRLLQAGAGLVLDLRYSSTKMAMMVERFIANHALRDGGPPPAPSRLAGLAGWK